MENKRARRIRYRMACEIQADGRTQRAIVLDFSRTGLFVQTSARLAPGTSVEVLIQVDAGSQPIRVRARVARQKAVPSNLTSVAQGGVGLQVLEAPPSYYAALEQHAGEASGPIPPPTPVPAARSRVNEERYRVRVKQTDGPRSRILDIRAESLERARARALAEVGKGWEIVEASSGG
jgi:hypothetical protein